MLRWILSAKIWAIALLLFGASRHVAAAPVQNRITVQHAPRQPRAGERVVITASAPETARPNDLSLQYQVVEPGNYIDLTDPAYQENWTTLSLREAAEPKEAGLRTFTAELPEKLQRNRRLVRYRLYSSEAKAVIAPEPGDARRNFAYFVYDGVPEWRAAINPQGSGAERRVVTFGTEVMRSVQAYHLISKQQSIENVTWRERRHYMHPSAGEYRYTGSLVAEGRVYDHVRIRARGGHWRYAMGKNMWKIDFNKGDHFEARDNWGRIYKTKWDKLNLGACIQQGDYGMRGEHGMFEAITYRLFNLARVDAPHTHWIQLRIVDSPDETPRDQYRGDFWGLYLVVENIKADFLKERRLPDGNIYKMDLRGPETEHIGSGQPNDRSDVLQFMSDIRKNPPDEWWRSNIDLDRYYSYRSIIECVRHYDIGMGKNYFYYRNPEAKRWQVIPWDVDLTWADQMFGNGAEPFYRTGFLNRDPFKREYLTRLAEIRDLLFNPEQTGVLIDEYAAVISNLEGRPSMVDADRAKWDYHPIMSSEFVVPQKSSPGLFYGSSPTGDFRGMLQLMKAYVADRGKWVDQTLLGNAIFLSRPTIAPLGKVDHKATGMTVQLTKSVSGDKVEWRVAEITLPGKDRTRVKSTPAYEINALMQMKGGRSAEIATKAFNKGGTYRIRARIHDANGVSRWSDPAQFTW